MKRTISIEQALIEFILWSRMRLCRDCARIIVASLFTVVCITLLFFLGFGVNLLGHFFFWSESSVLCLYSESSARFLSPVISLLMLES